MTPKHKDLLKIIQNFDR